MAIYNDVNIDVSFPLTIYSKLLGIEPTLDDLELINPGLAAGLRALLQIPSSEVVDYAAELCIDFEITTEDAFGVRRSVVLKKCGDVVQLPPADPGVLREGRPGATYAPGHLIKYGETSAEAEERGIVGRVLTVGLRASKPMYSLLLETGLELVDIGEDKLCRCGEDAAVLINASNREEFVARYVRYLLVDMVKEKFDAFAKGFRDICEGPALSLFRPWELQLLICGSPVLDFHELETAARYQDGFTEKSPIITQMWAIVHEVSHYITHASRKRTGAVLCVCVSLGVALPLLLFLPHLSLLFSLSFSLSRSQFDATQKRQFLAFATGSDRAPIGGLGRLRLTVSRMGPDSGSLPTSHTCFSHILIPEYSSAEKLKSCLLRAISEVRISNVVPRTTPRT